MWDIDSSLADRKLYFLKKYPSGNTFLLLCTVFHMTKVEHGVVLRGFLASVDLLYNYLINYEVTSFRSEVCVYTYMYACAYISNLISSLCYPLLQF